EAAIGGDIGPPALDEEVAELVALEQLVDEGIRGRGRDPEPVERGQHLRLAGGDPAGQADEDRFGSSRAVAQESDSAGGCSPSASAAPSSVAGSAGSAGSTAGSADSAAGSAKTSSERSRSGTSPSSACGAAGASGSWTSRSGRLPPSTRLMLSEIR